MINLFTKKRLRSNALGDSFTPEGVRKTPHRFSRLTTARLRREWKEFIAHVDPYPAHFQGQGIVICAGGISYFTCAWINISMLRKLNCTLPIEVWYNGAEELTPELISALEELNVVCKDIRSYTDHTSRGYAIKPFAILFSAFKEVLFLDADNNCTADPTYLFDEPKYQRTGAIFWPDLWKTARENPIWKIIDSSWEDKFEQESGQLLVNKERCWPELQLCAYFNRNRDAYYKILYGDKDTFRFAWLALRTPFHMVRHNVAIVGFEEGNGQFYGVSMAQHDTEGRVLFLHRNLLKWDITQNQETVWKEIKYVADDDHRRVLFQFLPQKGHCSLDFQGQVTNQSFTDLLGEYELVGLELLREVRESDLYRRFLIDNHFNLHRRTAGNTNR